MRRFESFSRDSPPNQCVDFEISRENAEGDALATHILAWQKSMNGNAREATGGVLQRPQLI